MTTEKTSAIETALEELDTHYILEGATVADAGMIEIKDAARVELAEMRDLLLKKDCHITVLQDELARLRGTVDMEDDGR